MTQPQVREGFRRIGMVLGWAAAILAIPAVISVTEPLSRSGSWWPTAKWGAIVIPAAYWCGATVARKAGWVIAGFFRPAPELERRKSFLESAKEEALKEFEDQPAALVAIKVREFIMPYLWFAAWVLGWIAADLAGDMVADYFRTPYALDALAHGTPGQISSAAPRSLIWISRVASGVLTFVFLSILITFGTLIFGDLTVQILERMFPGRAKPHKKPE